MIKELPRTHYSNYQAEKHLWAAVLASYVQDVIFYSKGKLTGDGYTNEQLRLAYKDFNGRQTTLARLCRYCDLEQQWIERQIKKKL